MTHYLIEFRFFGKAKFNIKSLIYHINRKFNLYHAKKGRPVPHITLVAPFSTNNQKRLVKDFKQICYQSNLMHFNVEGYGCFKIARVVYVNINPSKKLVEFRNKLVRKLNSYCNLNKTDVYNFLGIFPIYKEYSPHATIAMKLGEKKFKQIKSYIYKKKKLNYKHVLIRATLLKKGIILYEYDFLLKKLLTRKQAKSKKLLSMTLRKLRNLKSMKY